MKGTIKYWTICTFMLTITACDPPAQPSALQPDAASKHDTPYAVGSSTFFIHDATRSYDNVVGVDSGIRILITEIWYPVDHDTISGRGSEYRHATYGDYVFGDREMHRLMMTGTTFFHLTKDTVRAGVTDAQIDTAIEDLFLRERASYVDAPLAHSTNRWPVIVVTHGDAGSRYNMETVCEYLAEHGYVVIAPEHTGNSPYSLTGRDPALAAEGGDSELQEQMAEVSALLSDLGAYGSEASYGQSFAPFSDDYGSIESLRQNDRSLLQRLNDLRATLSKLDQMNKDGFAGADPGVLDLDRIGLLGRSYGATTTLMGLAMEPRFTAGFAVVPPGWADPRSSLLAENLAATDQESVLLAADGPFPLSTITKPAVLLSGADDSLLMGFSAFLAKAVGAPAPTPANPHPLVRQAYEATDAPVVWGLLANSNHSTFGVSAGYWWPELKPNTQARFFDVETEFELIAPNVAHQMQRELALAFFDLTIRGDESAKNRLLENRYEAEGLTLESRNF